MLWCDGTKGGLGEFKPLAQYTPDCMTDKHQKY